MPATIVDVLVNTMLIFNRNVEKGGSHPQE